MKLNMFYQAQDHPMRRQHEMGRYVRKCAKLFSLCQCQHITQAMDMHERASAGILWVPTETVLTLVGYAPPHIKWESHWARVVECFCPHCPLFSNTIISGFCPSACRVLYTCCWPSALVEPMCTVALHEVCVLGLAGCSVYLLCRPMLEALTVFPFTKKTDSSRWSPPIASDDHRTTHHHPLAATHLLPFLAS